MPSRTRDKQLAKLAARRQAERKAAKRRRDLTVGAVGGIVGLGLLVAGYTVLTGGDDGEPRASASASIEPPGAPGTRSGMVARKAEPPVDVACGAAAPKGAARPTPQFNGPPPMTIDVEATYRATIETSCGAYVIELRPDIAPVAVNSFVFLARKGFYDGLTFHRIVKGFVIQGGDPLGDGSGGPGYRYEIETSPKQTFDTAGLVAFANGGPGTNGSQFFVTLAPTPQLDPGGSAGEFTIFGEVTKGLDVVERIGRISGTENPGIPGEKSVPTQAVYIESVTIEERPA
jgi:cyclophilin family peptidyl-prolyl cis-trans isomerase